MRSFQTIGDEWPLPGMGVFQVMLSVLVQCRGRAGEGERPSLWGPRHMGQLVDSGARGSAAKHWAQEARTMLIQSRQAGVMRFMWGEVIPPTVEERAPLLPHWQPASEPT